MTSYPRENKSVTKCQFRLEEDLELVNLLHLSWYYEEVVRTARALLIAVWLKFPSFPLTLREMGQKKINAFAIDFLAKRLFFSAACFTWMKDEFDVFERSKTTKYLQGLNFKQNRWLRFSYINKLHCSVSLL